VNGDTQFENEESFFLELRRAGSLVRRGRGVIFNDDPMPAVTVSDVEVRETDGTTTAVLTFTATEPVDGSVFYGTLNGGTAIAGQDFVHRNGQAAFDHQTTATVEITILGDRIPEEHEQFTVMLWGSSGNFMLHDDAVVVTILDDDIGVGPDRLMIPAGESRRGLIQVGGPVATDMLFLLSSSAPDAISVPASVIMPAGQSRVTFDVQALAPGRRGEVTVTFPPSIADGSAQIRVWTYTKAELTLSPSELTLYPGQVVTVHASMTPTGEEVSIPLLGERTVEVPERLVIDATGHGSFTVKALANGPFVITATLPAAYGSEERRVVGRVSDPPSIPTLLSISPNNGSTAGGTRIDVHGALFRTDCELTFGGIPATVLQFVDTSTLMAIAPPQAAGPVDVELTCGTDVTSLRNAFTYRGVGPHLSAIAPSTGAAAGGTFVRITGQDFASSCWPFFGEVAAPEAIVRDANNITAVAPPHAAGTVDVRLLCTGNDALLAAAFTFTAASDPSPQILNIAPPFGAPGDIVTIEGTGFRPDDVVSFENVAARVLDSTPDTHTVVVPNLPPGRASVTIGSGTTVLATTGPLFIVGEASPPRISRVVPATAAAGAEIVLEGTSMRAPYTFAIEGLTMPLASLLPTRAVVRIPASLTPGTYPIAVMNAASQIATLGPAVNVRAEGVVVSTVAASCGATDGGIDVTITGSGFAAGAAVTFDDVPATNVLVVDATRIQARVPANYAGAATITVKNPDGSSSTLTDAFRYASPFDPSGCTSRRMRAVRH
jgi:hypothetical protein